MAETLREILEDRYREATAHQKACEASTLRLILAAIRERDAVADERGGSVVSDAEIGQVLEEMVRQRRAEIARCECTAQIDRASREADEMAVILDLLPKPLSSGETQAAVDAAIADTKAASLRDTGRVVAALKSRFAGRLNVPEAKKMICKQLA